MRDQQRYQRLNCYKCGKHIFATRDGAWYFDSTGNLQQTFNYGMAIRQDELFCSEECARNAKHLAAIKGSGLGVRERLAATWVERGQEQGDNVMREPAIEEPSNPNPRGERVENTGTPWTKQQWAVFYKLRAKGEPRDVILQKVNGMGNQAANRQPYSYEELVAEMEREEQEMREWEQRTLPAWKLRVAESAKALESVLDSSSEGYVTADYLAGGWAVLESVLRLPDGRLRVHVYCLEGEYREEVFDNAVAAIEHLCTAYNSFRDGPPTEWVPVNE